MRRWQCQEAKNKFSEMTRRAVSEGPQIVTKRGEDTLVVMSVEDYRKTQQREETLVEFLQNSPLAEVELDISRSKDTGREIEL